MSKFVHTEISNPRREILRVADHYIGLPVTVSTTGAVKRGDKKLVLAGTVIGGDGASVLAVEGTPVVEQDGVGAEGILLHDVDVTHGESAGSMVIHGVINASKIDKAVGQPSEASIEALRNIIFVGLDEEGAE